MRPDFNDAGIRRYLLGLLPESEAGALEDDYFARPELLGRVRAVEDDLLDDHAAGRLSPDEKGPFENRYLASPPLRGRVLAARALQLASVQAARRVQSSSVATRWPQWRGPLAMAAAILLVIVAFWRSPWRAGDVTTPVSPSPDTVAPTPLAVVPS